MRELLSISFSLPLVIAAIFAVVAAHDTERPRARWAKLSLLIFAVFAMFAGVIDYLHNSGRLGWYVRGSMVLWYDVAKSFRGISIGMFLVLWISGQFWGKKLPPSDGSPR